MYIEEELERAQAEKIVQNLDIMKSFVNRKTYRDIKTACCVRMPGKIKATAPWGKKKSPNPSITDFLFALDEIRNFLGMGSWDSGTHNDNQDFSDTYGSHTQGVLNSRGFHAATVSACIDILFKSNQYECIEQLCHLIDPDDPDEKAQNLRRNLLGTRNNVTRSNTVKKDLKSS